MFMDKHSFGEIWNNILKLTWKRKNQEEQRRSEQRQSLLPLFNFHFVFNSVTFAIPGILWHLLFVTIDSFEFSRIQYKLNHTVSMWVMDSHTYIYEVMDTFIILTWAMMVSHECVHMPKLIKSYT